MDQFQSWTRESKRQRIGTYKGFVDNKRRYTALTQRPETGQKIRKGQEAQTMKRSKNEGQTKRGMGKTVREWVNIESGRREEEQTDNDKRGAVWFMTGKSLRATCTEISRRKAKGIRGNHLSRIQSNPWDSEIFMDSTIQLLRALSIELFLKTLLISEETKIEGHDLSQLFENLEEKTKEEIGRIWKSYYYPLKIERDISKMDEANRFWIFRILLNKRGKKFIRKIFKYTSKNKRKWEKLKAKDKTRVEEIRRIIRIDSEHEDLHNKTDKNDQGQIFEVKKLFEKHKSDFVITRYWETGIRNNRKIVEELPLRDKLQMMALNHAIEEIATFRMALGKVVHNAYVDKFLEGKAESEKVRERRRKAMLHDIGVDIIMSKAMNQVLPKKKRRKYKTLIAKYSIFGS